MSSRFFFDCLEDHCGGPALVTQDGTEITYRELLDLAQRYAESLGVVRRLVFLEAKNSVSQIAAYLGCLIARHPVLLISAADRQQRDKLVEIFNPNCLMVADGDDCVLHRLHDGTLDLHPALQVLLTTSGSTGSAKLVKLSKTNIDANAKAIGQYLGLDVSDRAITSLKFNYSYGLSVINSHLASGASLLLTEEAVTSDRFWDEFDAYGATSFAGVPVTYEVLKSSGFAFSEHHTLRHATQAGGRLNPETIRHFAANAAQVGARFYVMYGQTEAAPRMAYLPPEHIDRHAECIGVAIPGGELLVMDDRGGVVTEPHCPGEIAYRGPNVMMGYATAKSDLATDTTPPLLRTGDVGCRNEAGLFYIVGRSARFAKPFGVRINLDDVESRLRRNGADVYCTQSDDRIVVGFVGTAAALERACRSLAGEYRIPFAAFALLPLPQIPLLESGKPDYRAMAAAYERRRRSWWRAIGRRVREAAAVVLSRDYFCQLASEFCILLTGKKRCWSSASQIVACLANTRAGNGKASVAELGVDSLSYVQVALGLEEFLGKLPPHWEHMPLEELDKRKVSDDALSL